MNRIIAKITIILFSLIFIFVVLFGLLYLANEYATPKPYEEIVVKYSFSYGVDANLVYAIMKTESNFSEKAKSHKGAVGLMQIMPQTAHYISLLLGETADFDLYDAETNIRFGIYYLSYLQKKFKQRDYVIIAYNAGEGNVTKWQKENTTQIPFPETEKYLKRVNKYLSLYKQKYNY